MMRLAKVSRQRQQAAVLSVDVIILTGIFFAMAYGVVFCLRRELVEFGAALSMSLVVFLWRVVQYDASRELENSVREYAPAPEPARRIQPVTVEATSESTYQIRYG